VGVARDPSARAAPHLATGGARARHRAPCAGATAASRRRRQGTRHSPHFAAGVATDPSSCAAPHLAASGARPRRRVPCAGAAAAVSHRRHGNPAQPAAPAREVTGNEGTEMGIFNYLPLLQMALLEIGLLDGLLRFCYRQTNEATHSPLSLTWHANSFLRYG
jgi:hypothetical protein